MTYINQCPLCKGTNCFEQIKFSIGEKIYIGTMCIKCRQILHSIEEVKEKELEELKNRFQELARH